MFQSGNAASECRRHCCRYPALGSGWWTSYPRGIARRYETTSRVSQRNAASVCKALVWGSVKLATAEHCRVISQMRCSPFSGCQGQVQVNLQRAMCLQLQMVRAVLKNYGALLKILQVSEKGGRYLKLCLHRRDFRLCISLPAYRVLKWSWWSFMGLVDFATLALVLSVGMWGSGGQTRLYI